MLVLLWIVGSVSALVSVGFLYQRLGGLRDRQRFAAAGRMVTVGRGCKLYLLEKGLSAPGAPTVIFEAGIAATNLNWFHVQQKVSHFAATVSYDRAGLGWSGSCRTPRTPANIALELHDMLAQAQIKPPYILVGHSFGGLVMRRFALLYPQEVASVVLVDPMRCEEWPPLNPIKQAELDRGRKLSTIAIPIARCGLARLAVTSLLRRGGQADQCFAAAAGDGVRHVLSRVKKEVGKMPSEVWPVVASHWSRPGFYAGMRSHVTAVPDTVKEMQNAEPILGVPVLLMTPGNTIPLSQERLARIGDNAQQVIAEKSAHWIHLDEPDLVIDSISAMVQAATSNAAPAVASR
jgi:pimeloyl-ACP methyl ester carboxylesterase